MVLVWVTELRVWFLLSTQESVRTSRIRGDGHDDVAPTVSLGVLGRHPWYLVVFVPQNNNTDNLKMRL